MTPAPLDLQLPPELAPGDLVALLGERLTVSSGRPRVQQRVLEDTFDGRLRAAGIAGERVPAARVAEVAAERALLPLCEVRSRLQPLAVTNADGKTVVRLEIETATVAGAALTPRLRVRPVRGYDRAFERVAGVLTGDLGLRAASLPFFDEAVTAAGRDPRGVSSKVGVKLAAGTRADQAAGRVLARLADVAEANVPGTLEDLDTEFLHDLRVAVRRARSVLREMRGVWPPREWEHLRDELKWVQQFSGPARDLDVQLLEWGELAAALPGGRDADLGPLRSLLEERRASALRDLRRGLRSKRFARAVEAWRALAATVPPEGEQDDRPRAHLPIEVVAADRIARVHRRMVEDGLAIDEDTPAEALHDLRKRGKELRYLLELFGALFPGKVVKPLVASLKDLQDVLGRFQDRAVQADLMRELGAELARVKDGPAALMALGLVVDALERDQRAAHGEFAERFAAFAAEDQRALVREIFPRLK